MNSIYSIPIRYLGFTVGYLFEDEYYFKKRKTVVNIPPSPRTCATWMVDDDETTNISLPKISCLMKTETSLTHNAMRIGFQEHRGLSTSRRSPASAQLENSVVW